MRNRRLAVIAVCSVFLINAGFSESHAYEKSGENLIIAQKTHEIDKKCREALGVGLIGVSMLLRAGPRTFLRHDSFSSIELRAVDDLKSAGYVDVVDINTADGLFIQLSPTADGAVLLKSLGK